MQKRIGHFSEVPSAKIDIFPSEEKQFSRPLPKPRKLLDHVRDVLRVNHYSARREESRGEEHTRLRFVIAPPSPRLRRAKEGAITRSPRRTFVTLARRRGRRGG